MHAQRQGQLGAGRLVQGIPGTDGAYSQDLALVRTKREKRKSLQSTLGMVGE